MTDERPWRKSSYSGSQAECVEAANVPSMILVRDTANRAGGTLEFSAAAWQTFTEELNKV